MPKLSIVVPVYNEARHLSQVIQVLRASSCPIEREWIFVEDCSKDESLQILKAHASQYKYRVIEQNPNQGKGAAVRTALTHARGEFATIFDADLEYDPADMAPLLAPLLDGRANGQLGIQLRFLRQVADAQIARRELDMPRVGGLSARDDPQQRGLAAAVGTDQPDALARAEVERHRVENFFDAVSF